MQYSEALGRSKPRSGTRTARSGLLILARVALGECYETKGPRDGERLAPFRNPADRSLGTYDSVVANIGRHREHREFIIYDGRQAYPELAIKFELRSGH